MTHRIKLLIGFVGTVTLTAAFFFGFSLIQTRRLAFQQIQSTVLSIAVDAASLIDGDLHETLGEGDDESEAYRAIELKLRALRDRHRRDDVYVAYIYTFRPVGEPSGPWEYVIDSDENDEIKPVIGERFEYEEVTGELNPLAEWLEVAAAEDGFLEDEYGVFFSAGAPVLNSNGDAVAVVGVDIEASDVVDQNVELLKQGLLIMGCTIALGIVVSLINSAAATRPLQIVREGVLKIADGDLDTRISGLAPDEFGQLGDAVNAMARSLQEREMLKEAFARYVSRDVAERIIESNELPRLEGTRQKVTILFTDIRDFTAWAEDVSPEDVVSQLNEYFTKMVEIVFANKGGIDKFIGDGMMAVFGAPLNDDEQEYHAVKAMIEMEEAARALAANWFVKGQRALQIGMAVHTGTAVVGNIGSEQKMDYTAIGRTVNVAARLEAKTKEFNTCGLVSADTYQAVRDRFDFEQIGSIQLRGVAQEMEIYTLPELRQSMGAFGASPSV